MATERSPNRDYAKSILQILVDAGLVGVMGVLPLFFYPWGLRNLFQPNSS